MRSIPAANLAELDALPATVDLPRAGRFWGIGRDASYRLAHSGQFPAKVHQLGARFVVTKADLAAALGVPLQDVGGGSA
ncbi:MAG TPA: hypothetical protein VGK17_09380 [Propionicimonas sp.]|jgi:hypothetical protein